MSNEVKIVHVPESMACYKIAPWRLGDDTLIQMVTLDEHGVEHPGATECISGKMADQFIADAVHALGSSTRSDWGTRNLIADERGVYGWEFNDGVRVEMWDCEEQSYSEYMKECDA